MNLADFYKLPEAGRLPQVGDTIRANYGSGLRVGYQVTAVGPDGWGEGYSFVCRMADGYDEIRIEQPALQPALFSLG